MNLRDVGSAPEIDPLGAIWELLKKLGSGVMKGLNAGNGFKEPPAWQGPEIHPALQANRDYEDLIKRLSGPAIPSMQPAQHGASPFGVGPIEVPPPLLEDTLSVRDTR